MQDKLMKSIYLDIKQKSDSNLCETFYQKQVLTIVITETNYLLINNLTC
jgi:hypothetical protein